MNDRHSRHAAPWLVIAVLLLTAGASNAQQTTERFIPIGESPGVSGEYSYIGEIVAIDLAARTITVRDDTGDHQLKMSEKTEIWIDRSGSKRQNQTGDYEDCEVGSQVEVMPEPGDRATVAWVKIDAG